MFKSIAAIYEALTQGDHPLNAVLEETEEYSEVSVRFHVENGAGYTISFFSQTDDNNSVDVRVISLIHVEDDMKQRLLPALNEINRKYRFLKFCCDSDGDVNVQYDFLCECADPSASAKELISYIVSIIDLAYPVLMRAMWAE